MRTTHHARHRIRQSADPFSQNRPFSATFVQWVCTLAATPPEVAVAPPPTGGNDAIQASDTPATRRQRASHGAKPPPQSARSAPRHLQDLGAAPVGAKNLAQHGPSSGSSAKKLAQHAQIRRIWGVLSAQGELFCAFAMTQGRGANFFAPK